MAEHERLTLSEEELNELTDRVRRSAQRRHLDALGIPYRLRADGSIVVLRADLDASRPRRPRPPRPDFAAIDDVA